MSDIEPSDVTSSSVQLINDSEFSNVLDCYDRILVDFYTDWCGSYQMMKSVLDELANDVVWYILEINVEDYPAIAKGYNVRAVPIFIVFKDGDPIKILIGDQEKRSFNERSLNRCE